MLRRTGARAQWLGIEITESVAMPQPQPVSTLKIDKSFMEGIPQRCQRRHHLPRHHRPAHSLGLTLVAEGVETDDQLTFLRQSGCEVYQGWLFAKAMAAQELTERLPQAISQCRALRPPPHG